LQHYLRVSGKNVTSHCKDLYLLPFRTFFEHKVQEDKERKELEKSQEELVPAPPPVTLPPPPPPPPPPPSKKKGQKAGEWLGISWHLWF
jgi:hypothetical protein